MLYECLPWRSAVISCHKYPSDRTIHLESKVIPEHTCIYKKLPTINHGSNPGIIRERYGKQDVTYTFSELLFILKKEGNSEIHSNTG